MSEEELLTVTVAASRHSGVFLLDSPELSRYTDAFLQDFGPSSLLPVGKPSRPISRLGKKLHANVQHVRSSTLGTPDSIFRTLYPAAERAVICAREPRRLLLQAACLAGCLQAPLCVLHEPAQQVAEIHRCLEEWRTREVYAVGAVPGEWEFLRNKDVRRLADEKEVVNVYLQNLSKQGPVRTLVLANPDDIEAARGGMSTLAPWIAVQQRAALILTDSTGENVSQVVQRALRRPELARADNLILAASLQAIPMERRPNPVADGKDTFIELEPPSPVGNEPFSFATGRLFHEDRAVVALMLARRRLMQKQSDPAALVVSNPGGGLPLLEAISRTTAAELENVGYRTTAMIGKRLRGEELRRLLPRQNIFLWEGHHATLIDRFGAHEWAEPLRPSLIFLQSCLALHEHKAQPFLEHGAVGVVGTSTRTYSSTGGALSLAFFDALLHDRQSIGGALRQAKNYLLAFALLKEKRLGAKAKLNGSSLRTAWAATLWGDPTQTMPLGKGGRDAGPVPSHTLRDNTLTISTAGPLQDVRSAGFQADVWANAHLAGLVRKPAPGQLPNLVPLVFAEVSLPDGPEGKVPRLRTRLAEDRWAFCWDARRRVGYVIALPRAGKPGEIRFQIDWQSPEGRQTP
jgi:hypothetical protein